MYTYELVRRRDAQIVFSHTGFIAIPSRSGNNRITFLTLKAAWELVERNEKPETRMCTGGGNAKCGPLPQANDALHYTCSVPPETKALFAPNNVTLERNTISLVHKLPGTNC